MDKHEKLIKQIKGVQRIVINTCHGGFGLSEAAVLRYLELCGLPVWPEPTGKFSSLTGPTYWLVPPDGDRVGDGTPDNWYEMTLAERQAYNKKYSEQVFHDRDVDRDDPYLVQVVEELGADANGRYAELKVVEIPADVDWIIEEYDGAEWVAERHRTWS